MADNHFATLVSKDSAINAVANPIYTQISDGSETLAIDASGNIGITDAGGSLTVDGTVAVSSVAGTVTVSATDLDIRDLSSATDSVSITDGGGSITVDGTVAVSSVAGTVTVSATDLDIRDLTLATDAVRVSANSSANSAGNPIFVSFTQAAITGEVHNYDTSTVAGGATDNHDYTVATAMLVKSIIVSSSGALKAELQTGPVASLVSKAVLFIPKTGGSQQVDFDPPIEVPVTGTGTVRIIRTNREGSSNDVYSTIIGIDA